LKAELKTLAVQWAESARRRAADAQPAHEHAGGALQGQSQQHSGRQRVGDSHRNSFAHPPPPLPTAHCMLSPSPVDGRDRIYVDATLFRSVTVSSAGDQQTHPPPHRPREDRLGHPADTSRSNLGSAFEADQTPNAALPYLRDLAGQGQGRGGEVEEAHAGAVGCADRSAGEERQLGPRHGAWDRRLQLGGTGGRQAASAVRRHDGARASWVTR
jgi:hypothetical protein